jgi:Flp pilus assembly secretin CpaC
MHKFTGEKRELVIWVKPYIVTPDSDRVVRMIKDIEQRYKEARDEVLYSVFD